MSRGTQCRTLRIDAELWDAFGRVAADRGTDRATLLREYMRAEVERAESATGDLFDRIGEDRRS